MYRRERTKERLWPKAGVGWDEFFAGGRHPYDWGPGAIGNNSQFAGYEGWSLTGETLLIGTLAYRLPAVRDLDWRLGPVYTDAIYLQVAGSAGNLWSYRVEGPTHTEGGSVVPDAGGTVRRELPFAGFQREVRQRLTPTKSVYRRERTYERLWPEAGFASKNSPVGHRNYLLGDVGVELRVRSVLFNDYDWDHFVRFSYGLNPTTGYGDVDQDLVQSSVARDAQSELSAEVEPPTLRVYVGFGTGW